MKMAVLGIAKVARTLATMATDVGGQGWVVPPTTLLHNGRKLYNIIIYHNYFAFLTFFALPCMT